LANGGVLPERPPSIVASPAVINLGANDSIVVTLQNLGDGSPTFTSVSSNAPWLTIEAEATDAAGLGEYRFSVDRTGLENGFYSAQAEFVFTPDITLLLNVSMQVGVVDVAGIVSEIFILLINTATEEVIDQVQVSPIAGQVNPFTFENIPPGTYLIFAGTDVDNDALLCQFGEACGSYPSVNDPLIIEVGSQDVGNLSFTVDILDGFATFISPSRF